METALIVVLWIIALPYIILSFLWSLSWGELLAIFVIGSIFVAMLPTGGWVEQAAFLYVINESGCGGCLALIIIVVVVIALCC